MIGSGVLADAEKIVGNDGTESFIPNEKIFLAALIVSVAVILYLILFGYLSKKIEAKGATEVSE
jgi:hypothetical protein